MSLLLVKEAKIYFWNLPYGPIHQMYIILLQYAKRKEFCYSVTNTSHDVDLHHQAINRAFV